MHLIPIKIETLSLCHVTQNGAYMQPLFTLPLLRELPECYAYRAVFLKAGYKILCVELFYFSYIYLCIATMKNDKNDYNVMITMITIV